MKSLGIRNRATESLHIKVFSKLNENILAEITVKQ